MGSRQNSTSKAPRPCIRAQGSAAGQGGDRPSLAATTHLQDAAERLRDALDALERGDVEMAESWTYEADVLLGVHLKHQDDAADVA